MSTNKQTTKGQPAADKPAQGWALVSKRKGRALRDAMRETPSGPVPDRVTSRRVKAAWIRDDVPAGAPAPGRFDCECGRPVRASYFGQGPDVACECGIVYDNMGWIK